MKWIDKNTGAPWTKEERQVLRFVNGMLKQSAQYIEDFRKGGVLDVDEFLPSTVSELDLVTEVLNEPTAKDALSLIKRSFWHLLDDDGNDLDWEHTHVCDKLTMPAKECAVCEDRDVCTANCKDAPWQ